MIEGILESMKARREQQALEAAPQPAVQTGERGHDEAADGRASKMWSELDKQAGAPAGKKEVGGKIAVEPAHSLAFSEMLFMLAASDVTAGEDVGTYQSEHQSQHASGEAGGRTTQSDKTTLDLRGGGVTVGHETEIEHGVQGKAPRTAEQLAAERDRISAAITSTKEQLVVEQMLSEVRQLGLGIRIGRVEREMAELEQQIFDPELREGRLALMRKELKDAREEVDKVEADQKARKTLLTTLDEGLADLKSVDDTWELARELAAAEDAYRVKLKIKTKDTASVSLLKGTISRERGVTEISTDEEGGTTTTSHQDSSKVTTGKGVHRERTQQQGYSIADADGNVISAEETTKTTSGGISVGEGGSVGLTGSSKLSKAIETSHGKTTHSVSCGGGVNVNVIALPKKAGGEQQFSVVMTLNLEAALAFGAEKKKAGKHATKKVGLDASAKLEGQLTHTHILDAAGATAYLAALEQAGAGDKGAASKAPEFSLLQKAITGLQSVDELASAATATAGSPDAAARLGADESVELTLKAGASIDASLGASSEDEKTSLGASGGLATEAYRTLKIAGVAGKPGQDLVDVTVMFGSGSDQHGALTASALGVSVSAGAKQWGKGEQAVTFRLDAAAGEEYRSLYSEIVATSSRDSLLSLRQSERFRRHVLAYSSKSEEGGETSLGISGMLGVATKDSWSRSSSRGQNEDGELTAGELGTSSTSVGFSVGPLELLRRQQTASANFQSRDGVSTLDLSLATEKAGLGGFEVPSFQELLAAESPLKALEAAITETRKTLAGFLLDPEDLLAVARRAKDEAAWSRVPIAAKIHTLPTDEDYRLWAELRRELVNPTLSADASLEHITLEREIARGRAIADFMSSAGKAKGIHYLQCVLRDYGAQGGDNEDVGLEYEFPEGIKPEDFMDLRFKMRTIESSVSGLLPIEGFEACVELEESTAKMLDQLGRADFTSERARLEMIGELRERAIDVARCRRSLERDAGLSDDQASDESAESVADARTRVHHREQQVIQSKSSELRLVQRCETVFNEDLSSIEIEDQLGDILKPGGRLDEVFELHVRNIVALRATYKAAGTPKADWLVSADTSDEARLYDVDMDRALDVLWAYYKSKPLRLGEGDYEPRRASWHRHFWSY